MADYIVSMAGRKPTPRPSQSEDELMREILGDVNMSIMDDLEIEIKKQMDVGNKVLRDYPITMKKLTDAE